MDSGHQPLPEIPKICLSLSVVSSKVRTYVNLRNGSEFQSVTAFSSIIPWKVSVL